MIVVYLMWLVAPFTYSHHCIMDVSGGGTTLVMCDLHNHYTLYCMCLMISKCNWRASAEANTIGEQQQKRTLLGSNSLRGHSRGSTDEDDTVREQQMKQIQLGSSWVWPHKTSGRQRHYRTRVLVHQSNGLQWPHYEGGESPAYAYLCLQ